jgi:hypothetical protein
MTDTEFWTLLVVISFWAGSILLLMNRAAASIRHELRKIHERQQESAKWIVHGLREVIERPSP